MLTYQEISQYVDQGKSNVEIADAINADLRHFRDAYITGGPSNTTSVNILFLLTSKWSVLRQNAAQIWIGSLVDLAEQNAQVKQVLEQLFPYLQLNDAPVYCGVSQDAAMLVEFLIGVVGSLVSDVDMVRADVSVLTGGRRYGNVTEQEVADIIVSNQIEEARQTVLQAGAAQWNAFVEAVDAWDGSGIPPALGA